MTGDRPVHLGPSHGAQFSDASVAQASENWAPYPEAVFDVLRGLLRDEPRTVLDLGCGRGEIARSLVSHVDRVDADDPPVAMIEEGKRLPGGDAGGLRWIACPAETAPLEGPYGLVTAGNSLHWMDWPVLFKRLVRAMSLSGNGSGPWDKEITQIIRTFSTNRPFRPFDLVGELTGRGLFRVEGSRDITMTFHQPVTDFVESFHARNGFSRQRMDKETATRFDASVRDLVELHMEEGILAMTVPAEVVWSRRLAP